MPLADLRAHAYEPTEWEDRVVDQTTGAVLVEGTPVDEVHLNNIESALLLAHLDIGNLAEVLASYVAQLNVEIAKFRRQRILQGTATITRSGTATYFTDYPFVDIALPTDAYPQINSPNYTVLLEILSASDWGAIGQLQVVNKAQNGFRVQMTGSASSVTFRWTLINMIA